ncbi:MAG: hemerythrin domain-containing protein [Alphaproteobacteria bacterium]|nr:hemerythrin domain-containing protein [Alphaproteobacteria bacterium]
MLDFFTEDHKNAISILKDDHKKVKRLFDKFDDTDNKLEKRKIIAQAIKELKIHAAIEEEIFYPTVRNAIDKKIMTEADEEHHVAKILIAELEDMKSNETHFEAKFIVLAENVRHHIKEEERDMLPKASHLNINMKALGLQMLARKQELTQTGVDRFSEETFISSNKGNIDSPAQAAKKNKPSAVTKAKNQLSLLSSLENLLKQPNQLKLK